MTIRALLRPHARALASGRGARWAARVVLLGGCAVAVALFLARAGYPVPWIEIPGVPMPDGTADRVFGFLAVSFAGLWQGAALLAVVFGAALFVRYVLPALMRGTPARTADALDRVLRTDRFTSALEARGPLAALVEERAVTTPPPPDTLGRRRSRFLDRWLRRFIVAIVLVVALAPGTAPGEDGEAPVAGAPDGGRDEQALTLQLLGEKEVIALNRPAPVQVIAEAAAAPAEDLELPIRLRIDDERDGATDVTLFLAAGAPGQDAVTFDLAPFLQGLEPGEHSAVAYAGDVESNAYVFRIEPPGDGGGGGAKPPPQPDEQPEEKPQDQQQQGGAQEKPKFVEPLVRDDEKVRKEKAKVPIEVRGGGAPAEMTLEEAWPELLRRKEADLKRPGLSPVARKLVKEYFDRLRPPRK